MYLEIYRHGIQHLEAVSLGPHRDAGDECLVSSAFLAGELSASRTRDMLRVV